MKVVKYREGGDNHELRAALHDAWKGRCYWGAEPTEYRNTQIDHIVPKSLTEVELDEVKRSLDLDRNFDVHDPMNLAPICGPCNEDKGRKDYTAVPLIKVRLDRAGRLRNEVIRRVERFHDPGRLEVAAMLIKEADLSDPRCREVLELHGPGLVQALALQDRGLVGYTVYQAVTLEFDDDTTVRVGLTLDDSSRLALAVLEDACGGSLEELVRGLADVLRREVLTRGQGRLRGLKGGFGGTNVGSPGIRSMRMDVSSVLITRAGGSLEFGFGGDFETDVVAHLFGTSAEDGEPEDLQGYCYLEGTYSHTATCHELGGGVTLNSDYPEVTVRHADLWTE